MLCQHYTSVLDLHKHNLSNTTPPKLAQMFVHLMPGYDQAQNTKQTKTVSRLRWWYNWMFGDGNWIGSIWEAFRPPTVHYSISNRCLSLLLSSAQYFIRSGEVGFIETPALTDLKPHKYFNRDLIKPSFKTDDKVGSLSVLYTHSDLDCPACFLEVVLVILSC